MNLSLKTFIFLFGIVFLAVVLAGLTKDFLKDQIETSRAVSQIEEENTEAPE